MKKWPALLLAALMVVMTAVPAMAYTAVTPSGNPAQADSATKVTHTLTLDEAGNDFLPYKATYTFAVGDPTITEPTVTSGQESGFVTGKPSISNVVYDAGTFTDKDASTNKYYKTNDLTIDWTGVSIKEPGTYEWTVSESVAMDPSTAGESATANLSSGKLVAFVIDNNGTLQVGTWYFVNDSTNNTKGNVNDTFPATINDLEVKKVVTGNKGSKDQYFQFEIKVTVPNSVPAKNYTISGFDDANTVNASPYNSNATQPNDADTNTAGTQVSLTGGTEATVMVWLKHDQTVKIEGLPSGTQFTATEVASTATGYDTPTGEVKTKTDVASGIDATITNNKEATTPTGIILQYGAPIAGILLVIVMMTLLFVSKRRKYEEE